MADNGLGMNAEKLLYEFGKLVRNTDRLSPSDWGWRAMDLLEWLREMDEQRYNSVVRRKYNG